MADLNNGDLNGKPVEAGPAASEPVASAPDRTPPAIESPKLAPDQEQPATVEAKSVTSKSELPDAKTTAAAPSAAPRAPGKIMIMAPMRDNAWDGDTIEQDTASTAGAKPSGLFGKRRASALAAVIALAAVAGAIGGSLATAGFGHVISGEEPQATASRARALENSLTRLESDVAALKTSIERSAKGDISQFSKVNDRIEKVEKAQIEPAAKLAKISDTLDKLRIASAPAAATVASVPAPAKTSPGRSRRLPPCHFQRRSRRLPGCRPSKAGFCAMWPMAVR